MRKFLVMASVATVLASASTVSAGVLNSYDDFKNWVNGQNVHTGVWYDVVDSEFGALVGTSLYDIKVNNQDVSFNVGYADEAKSVLYANIAIDPWVAKLVTLIPFKFDLPIIDMTYSVGGGGGYDWNDRDVAVGIAMLGAKINLE